MTRDFTSTLRPAAPATLTATLALALALLLAPSFTPPLAAQAQGRVAGKVMDQDGEPLEDVEVTLWSPEVGIEITTETNRGGRFTISVVDSTKPYMIRLEKEGFLTVEEPADPPIGGIARKEWNLIPEGSEAAAEAAGQVPQEVQGKREAVNAYNAGAEAYNTGDFDTALAKFEEAVEVDPEMMAAKEILGGLYIERERHDDALELAEQILASDPANVTGLTLKYDALEALGRTEEAAPALDALFAAEPDDETAVRLFNAGVTALRTDDRELAEKRFRQAVEANPDLAQGHAALARLHVAKREWEQALEHAETLLALDEADVTGLSVRYDALRALDRTEEAEEAFDALRSASPETIAEAFFKQGQELFDAGQNDAAIAAFEKVVAARPDHPRGNYSLGLAYLSAGETAKARECLERFLELAPDDPEAESARQMLQYLE